MTRWNTRAAYEALYRSDRLVGEYLTPERMAFYEAVAVEVAALQPLSVLDVGCGTGHLLRAVKARLGASELFGIDYAKRAIRRSRRVVPDANLEVADLFTFAPGRTFDLVLCTEVLEHLADPESARTALGRLVAPAGHIVATVPDGEQDDWEGHVNFWSLDEFRTFLEPLGQTRVRRLEHGTLLAVVEVAAARETQSDPSRCGRHRTVQSWAQGPGLRCRLRGRGRER